MFMRWMRGVVLAAVAGTMAAGCSAEPVGGDGSAGVKRAVFQTPQGARELAYVERDGYAVVEGDILFELPEKRSPENPAEARGLSQQSVASNVSASRWPGGVVPYEIDPALPNPGRVTEGIARVQSGTQVRLIPRNGHADYVRFVRIASGPACYSWLGRQGGMQEIQLTDNCNAGSVAHEIGHAVGLIHEHQRSDRDSHIRIFLDRVDPEFHYAFDIRGAATPLTAYDTTSIMHYPSHAFATGTLPTITRLDGTLIPGAEVLSATDRAGLNAMYANPSTGRPVGSAVAAAGWGTRVDLFWRGAYGDVQYRWIEAGQNRGWSRAESLGSPLGKPFVYDPAAVSYGAGHVEVFVVGADNAVWHKWFMNGGWSGWESLGGHATSSPSAASLHYGHIDLFVRGSDMGLWHRYTDWPGGIPWQNWSSLGGRLSSGPAAVAPNLRFQQAGKDRLFVYVFADNGALYGIAWSLATNWGGWTYMGEEGSHTSDPAAVSLGPDNVSLFWRGTQQQLVHKNWNGSTWGARTSYDGILGEAPRATFYGNLQLAVFAPSFDWQTAYVKTWGFGAGFASFNPVFDGWTLCGGLNSGQPLWNGASILSCDGRFRIAQQTDGNLVLYEGASRLWQNGRFGSGHSTTMQTDGNLVTSSPSGPVWFTHTYGNGGAHFALQNDGNGVIYATSGAPLWSTGTCCR
jgi:hypothetical protein